MSCGCLQERKATVEIRKPRFPSAATQRAAMSRPTMESQMAELLGNAERDHLLSVEQTIEARKQGKSQLSCWQQAG